MKSNWQLELTESKKGTLITSSCVVSFYIQSVMSHKKGRGRPTLKFILVKEIGNNIGKPWGLLAV